MIVLGVNKVQGNLRMLGNNVLLEPMPLPSKSKGGIHLLDNRSFVNDSMQYRVLAVGPGIWKTNRKTKVRTFVMLTDVAVGDVVLCKAEKNCQPVDDGTGRIVIDAGELLMSWKQPEATTYAN